MKYNILRAHEFFMLMLSHFVLPGHPILPNTTVLSSGYNSHQVCLAEQKKILRYILYVSSKIWWMLDILYLDIINYIVKKTFNMAWFLGCLEYIMVALSLGQDILYLTQIQSVC
jgi:hypothetical protein